MPGIQQTFPRIPTGPLTPQSAAVLNDAFAQLARILNLNVVPPMWLIPNAGSYTIGVDLQPDLLFARRPAIIVTEEVIVRPQRTLVQYRPVYYRRPVIVVEEPVVVVRRSGGAPGESKKVESFYTQLASDTTCTFSSTTTMTWSSTTPITTPNFTYPSSDYKHIKYTGSNENLVMVTVAVEADATLPANTPQLMTVNLLVNGSIADTAEIGLCGEGDTDAVNLYPKSAGVPLKLSTNDVVTVDVVNADATFEPVVQASGTVLTFYDFPGGLDQQHSP